MDIGGDCKWCNSLADNRVTESPPMYLWGLCWKYQSGNLFLPLQGMWSQALIWARWKRLDVSWENYNFLDLCGQRGGRDRAGALTNLGIFAQTNLTRLEMPKLTGVTALAQNYLFLSLNALYEINQITIFLFQFFIPTCSDTLVGITTLLGFQGHWKFSIILKTGF